MTNPINPSDGNKAQEEYLKILDDITRKITEAVKALEKQANQDSNDQANQQSSPIRVYVGQKKVYEQTSGQEPTKNAITPEQVEKVRKAVEDPQDLKGSVKINVGRETVYHAKDGQVIADKLNLAQAQAQTASQDAKSTQAQAAAPTQSLEAQIAALLQTVEKQGERIDSLEKKVDSLEKKIDQLASSRPQAQAKNPKLSQFLNSTNNAITGAARGLKEKVAGVARNLQDKAVEQAKVAQGKVAGKAQNVQNQVGERVSATRDKAVEQVSAARDQAVKSVQQAAADINGRLISSATEILLQHIGSRQKDGSVAFEGNKYLFEKQNGEVKITAKDGQRTVLENGKFTEKAYPEDAIKLSNLPGDVERDWGMNQSQSQSQSQSRGRSR